jgi:hypothetical protein
VFAIIDPLGTGNLQPFRQQMQSIEDVGVPAPCDLPAPDSQPELEPEQPASEPELAAAAPPTVERDTLAR